MKENNDPIFTAQLINLGEDGLEDVTDYFNEAIKIPKHVSCSFITTVFNAT